MDPDVNENEFLDLARRDVGALLAASLDIVPCAKSHTIRGGRSGNHVWVSLPGSSGREVRVSRTKPLTPWEARILEPYGDALQEISKTNGWIFDAASTDAAFHAVAVLLGDSNAKTVEECLRSLLESAASTYEGQARNLNLLLDLTDKNEDLSKPKLSDIRSQKWYPVLGSGINTGMRVDQHGRAYGLEELKPPKPDGTKLNAPRPYAFGAIGDWTADGPNRLAFSLTRSSELLVHHDGELRAIYRTRRWHGLPFEAISVQAWSTGSYIASKAKKGVLASITDACLGHHGAAIGIISRGRLVDFNKGEMIDGVKIDMVDDADRWPKNVRSTLFPQLKFQDLPRRLRLEMLSMDGATILDHQGNILAAGAIVKVGSGSSGGGRTAAAMALAKYGTGIKVSQDGPVEIFRVTNSGVVEKVTSFA